MPNIIETQKVNAEYAVAMTADNFAEMFSSMDDAYMQARAADVKDISEPHHCQSDRERLPVQADPTESMHYLCRRPCSQ